MTLKTDRVIRDVRIPRVVLSNPDFGGTRDGAYQRGDLLIRDDQIRGLISAEPSTAPRLVLPALVEAHCHLDKCHSLHRLGQVGGDLEAAITAQTADKANWTRADLGKRARQGLTEASAAGCRVLRSHIDWPETTEPPSAWLVLPELPTNGMTLQLAALTGIDQMADAEFARSVAKTVSYTPGGVLGSFILNHRPDVIREGLRNTVAEAERLGLALDFHVDETLDDLDGVEAVADMVLETGFQGPVLCGHAVALTPKPATDLARIADKLARADITICTLPTTNLYLQGRRDGTPDDRGLTRVKELMSAGVRVIVGSDNVADAFCPLGQHDPLAALHLACLAGHLDPPLDALLPMVTTDAARALGLPPVHVDRAHTDQLLISTAPDAATLIAGRAPVTPLNHSHDATHAHPERNTA